MPVPTIDWKKDRLRIIDQTLLPGRLSFIDCRDARSVYNVIRRLNVRGAPAIGIAGAFGLYLGVRNSRASVHAAFLREVEQVESFIASSRPTARNLFWGLERMVDVVRKHPRAGIKEIKKALLNEALLILREDKAICRAIGDNGSRLLNNGDTFLTHCNAGGLATADYGTALALFFSAKKKGKKFRVFVDETRPVLQGSRLTAWELLREKIDATLICDNMAASLMAKGKIDKIVVGADRIAINGDVANKIGTYNLACLAAYHGIPFYVAAPVSTFDMKCRSGRDIVIEERDPDEVRKVMGNYIAPARIKVYNPAFDVTPHGLVTAIVTEHGIIKKPDMKKVRAFIRKAG
jgi:methylthioribose-1-phosphate isomerase